MSTFDAALLVLRLGIGLIFAVHGAQKLFGWWKGPGFAGWQGAMSHMGFRPARLFAGISALAEFAGGLGLALGLLTPFAAIALVVVMLNAIITVHWQKGFFVTAGGYEYNLTIIAIATGVSAIGPGTDSLDNALGIAGSLSGEWWAPIVLVVAAVISVATTTLGREHSVLTGHPVS